MPAHFNIFYPIHRFDLNHIMMTFASTVRPAQQREVITLQSRLALVLAAALIAAVAPAAQASDVFSGDVSLSSLPRRAASRPDVLTLVLSPTKRNYRVNLPPMNSSAFGRRINTFEVPITWSYMSNYYFAKLCPCSHVRRWCRDTVSTSDYRTNAS